MSNCRYRIPRMVIAVMVLGAHGCGDDDKEGDTPRDDGGGAGDGRGTRDGDGEPLDERFRAMATKECDLLATCEEDGLVTAGFDSEQECVDEYVQDYQLASRRLSRECLARFLDFYDCYLGFGCDTDESDVSKCERSYQAYVDACEGMGDI